HYASGLRLGALPRTEKWRQTVVRQMRTSNPMWKRGVKAKMVSAMKGRTFLGRGGNGQLTIPQQRLATALGLPMEVAIATRPVQTEFPSLPNCYKVDIGAAKMKLA